MDVLFWIIYGQRNLLAGRARDNLIPYQVFYFFQPRSEKTVFHIIVLLCCIDTMKNSISILKRVLADFQCHIHRTMSIWCQRESKDGKTLLYMTTICDVSIHVFISYVALPYLSDLTLCFVNISYSSKASLKT